MANSLPSVKVMIEELEANLDTFPDSARAFLQSISTQYKRKKNISMQQLEWVAHYYKRLLKEVAEEELLA